LDAHAPGSPARPTSYWASIRSNTVVTTRSPTRRTGTPRRTGSAVPSVVSKCGSTISAVPEPSPSSVRAGLRAPSSRFHLPRPSSPNRWPSVPLGIAGASVTVSHSAGLNIAFSLVRWSLSKSPATRNLPGLNVPSACSSSSTRKGRSVYFLQ